MEWVPINKETTIFNFLPRAFWRCVNLFKFKNVCFIDTSFIIRKKDEPKDNRIEILPTKNREFITSSLFKKETDASLNTDRYETIYAYNNKTIDFEDFRKELPQACPLYYNFIHSMFNPANISSVLFWKERYISNKIYKNEIGKTDEKLNKIISQFFNESKNRKIGVLLPGDKNLSSLYVDEALPRYYKKKTEAINKINANYFNDLKSLSLALLFCITKRVNLHFYTSDSDFVVHLRQWIDSISHQLALRFLISHYLQKDNGLKRIWSGKESVVFKIPYDDYLKMEEGIREDFLANDWKKGGYFFQIHSWDNNRKKIIDDIKIHFNRSMEESLLNIHGAFSCPFVNNNTYANCFAWQYVWPPTEGSKNIINTTVFPKIYRNFHSRYVDKNHHEAECLYSKSDKNKNYKFLTTFAPPNFDILKSYASQ